jgi:hypothetical protein
MRFVRRFPRQIILSVVLVVFVAIALSTAALAEGFDKPVRETNIDLGPSSGQPDYPNLHVHLSCWYYPDFMVKQLGDDGNKGALRISVLRVQALQAPTCNQPLAAEEKELQLKCEYYWGGKGQFIFLIDCDGEGEGMHVTVFEAGTLNALLNDSLRFNTSPTFGWTADGRLSMRYERVFFADCSLMYHGVDCWKKIRSETGLSTVPMPNCRGYVEPNNPRILEDPSLIGYQVQRILSPKMDMKILPGPVHCFAAQ